MRIALSSAAAIAAFSALGQGSPALSGSWIPLVRPQSSVIVDTSGGGTSSSVAPSEPLSEQRKEAVGADVPSVAPNEPSNEQGTAQPQYAAPAQRMETQSESSVVPSEPSQSGRR